MTHKPYDPMQSAAMREARAPKQALFGPDAPPLSAEQERALIEARVQAGVEEMMGIVAGVGLAAEKPLTVRQVNGMVQQCLAATLPPVLYIVGEISNFRTYDRGHAFFTLKEPGAELPCVLWKDGLARLKFKPRDGLAVIARGSVKLYEPQGKLQFYVETLLPQGAGALELAFRQLCEKLRAEGLFEAGRKRAIPLLPEHVAIITSRTGDVLHDVLTTAYRRFPGLHTMLYPVRVQGEAAAPEIVRAIGAINKHAAALGGVDLILLVRGGGSLEDLWAFNEEAVARAIVASAIPVATGIGHEPDTTIADLVGDLRGPTPTGVTELTIPDAGVLRRRVDNLATLLGRDVRRTAELSGAEVRTLLTQLAGAAREAVRQRGVRIEDLARAIAGLEPRHAIAQGWRRVEEAQRNLRDAGAWRLGEVNQKFERLRLRLEGQSPAAGIERQRGVVQQMEARLRAAAHTRLMAARQRVSGLAGELRVVSPQAVLERGFSITSNAQGKIVRSTKDVATGEVIRTRLADGSIDSTVGKPKQGSLF